MSDANVDKWLLDWSIWWAELKHSIAEAAAILAGAWAAFHDAFVAFRDLLASIWGDYVVAPSMAIWVRYRISPSMAADVGGRALYRAWLANGRPAELHQWRRLSAPWRYGHRWPVARRWT